MKRYRLLDLFCKAGGASMGYHQSGFDVVGVDIEPQPKYPFKFVQADVLTLDPDWMSSFDAIHASPPCQAYSLASKQFRVAGKVYSDLIEPTRNNLKVVGLPYIIENVPGSPLIKPFQLCGSMFGLSTYRHRLFETSFRVGVPDHPEHQAKNAKMGRVPKDGEFIQIAGHFSGVPFARKAMGISWMGQKELAQAIPPAYTKFIGEQLWRLLNRTSYSHPIKQPLTPASPRSDERTEKTAG